MFYINYEECKYADGKISAEEQKSFILTMRNVNFIFMNNNFNQIKVLY